MAGAKKTFAVLGAGLLQQPLIAEGVASGFKVIALDQNPEAFAREVASEFITVQIADAAQVIAALKTHQPDLAFVCTIATDFTHIVAQTNEALGLTGTNIRQGEVLTHKGKMRDFCREHNHLHPPYICTRSKEDCVEWAAQNPSADGFVIKPVQNMGARGVMFLRGADELAFAHEFAAHFDKNAEVILEHYIPAREISVDALCFEGQVFLTGVADRLIEIKDRHFFIETGHTLPGNFTTEQYALILQAMQRYADSLGTLANMPYHGALKGDLRLTGDNKIVIGEVAGRLSGGFMSTHTYPAAHGRNLMQMYIRLMLRDKSIVLTHGEAIRTMGVAIERSLYTEPGEIQGLPNANELAEWVAEFKPRGVLNAFCNYKNGDTVTTLQNNVGKALHTVIKTNALADAEQVFSDWKQRFAIATKIPEYNGRAMAKIAREKFNNDFCWVCKVCDGGYCASGVPGMGGRGEMNSFRDNIAALQEFKIAPSYTSVGDLPQNIDIALNLFGNAKLRLNAPILSAPITGSVTNMGGSITEFDYAIETGSAMKELGLMPTFGDGASADKYRVGLHAINLLGRGIPVFKPRADQDELIHRIAEAEASGAIAWGMDIDGVSFKTMVNRSAATGHKSLADIRELAQSSRLPFIVKGIMTERDAATAIDAGAAAIVVSNHGGRVLDGMPGTARVLPAIAALTRRNAPHVQIFSDGGVRSGADIFRMLALGAHGVLIGRPIAIMAVGMGRTGVKSLLTYYIRELEQTLRVCGLQSLADIQPRHITKFI